MLSYKGMGDFPEYTANMPTQLWIAARYFESIAFLLAILLMKKNIKYSRVFWVAMVVVALLLGSILYFGIFPACFIEGVGLTSFKIYSEYIISLIFLVVLYLFIKNKKEFNSEIFGWFIIAIVSTIVGELAFTSYISVYGPANMIGHLAKLIAFFYLYKVMISYTVLNPLIIFSKKIIDEKIQLEKSLLES